MGDAVLLSKLGLALGSSALTLFALRHPLAERLSPRAFSWTAFATLACVRLSTYVAVLLVLGVPAESDVLTYYSLAKSALAGGMPYRDFFNGYGPLFPFAVGVPVAIWDSPKSIILCSVLIELVSLPVWLSVARSVVGEGTARAASILYVFNPFATVAIALSGQNNVWLSLSLAVSLHFLFKRRDAPSGLALGAGIVLAKFLSLLQAPILFANAPNRWRWVWGFAALPVLIYGYFFAHGASIAAQLAFHASDHSSGNLPFLLTLFNVDSTIPSINRACNLFGVAAIALVLAAVLGRAPRPSAGQVLSMIVLVLLTLMLVSRKAFTSYLIITLFPLCLMIAAEELRRRLIPYLVFGVVIALESSLWFRWMHNHGLEIVWHAALPADVQRWSVFAFLGVELTLLGFYFHYALLAFRGSRPAAERAEVDAP